MTTRAFSMTKTNYEARVQARLEAIRAKGGARILAIETSCDETAAAVVESGSFTGAAQELGVRVRVGELTAGSGHRAQVQPPKVAPVEAFAPFRDRPLR